MFASWVQGKITTSWCPGLADLDFTVWKEFPAQLENVLKQDNEIMLDILPTQESAYS